ncbi:hypothetical protein E0L36_24985 [Streptomyces sp. AJS327]|uniref:DUF6177 family protein n=1 Tax=Streptomyces sp. AJS327 TaxID=2545265 RepID=UPI0015DDA731|nr:DUF6177 family protein [Streptomyces sp. AJS327]MBA0053986.1 hypothetical protein [Streptomyces sp. AJS327]
MTEDAIALTARCPDTWAVLAGLLAAGPDARVGSLAEGALIQLCAADGGPLVTVESPQLLRVPGEAARLLGAVGAAAPHPVWWTEARGSSTVPEGGALAGAFASRVAAQLEGAVWPPEAAAAWPGEVVPTDLRATHQPPAAQPGVDLRTDRTAVVFQDRDPVPATAWLADALRGAAESGRTLALVTPPGSRITPATRALLAPPAARWVVRRDDGGYRDGLHGTELHWRDGEFTARTEGGGSEPELATVAREFTAPDQEREPGERQLTVRARTVRAPTGELLLGGALETIWRALTGAPPDGWGTAEPVTQRWSRAQLTDRVRDRAPRPTWLVAVGFTGTPGVATLRTTRTSAGVEERATLTLGYRPGAALPLDALPALAEELSGAHGLRTLLVESRAARADLTVPPRAEGAAGPVAFALGPGDVAGVGTARADSAPLPGGARPRRLGGGARPGYYFPLGPGDAPEPGGGAAEQRAAWREFEELVGHLRATGG